ncbi:B3 domain-containing protein Os01g0723500-like isoform X2 [Henckelia pumila]|uniref:B3 domain-containing protein Os01g0723500-like isoform X2 n=1 Tax=Henckelia pumila TaxID=405737 RepID=UPI003C6DD08C
MCDIKRPYFLRGFAPSTCSERLNIPCSFIKHMEGRASGTTTLVGPSGNNWYAELILIGDGLFFSDGWEAFASDHFLEQGDFLVFGYDGDLQFTVLVFDQSMCEKEAALKVENHRDINKNGGHVVKKRDRDISALPDSIVEGVPKRGRCSEILSDCAYKIHLDSTSIGDDNGGTQEADQNNKLNNTVTVAVSPTAAVQNDYSDLSVRNRNTKLDMLLSPLEADRIARSFASSLPNFVKVMKRFNISGSYTLNIPYQFAMEHLPKCKLQVLLHSLKGGCWTVNSIPNTKLQTSHTFCGGWLSFVRDNDIDVGDICIFELVRKFELRVRILRVRKEGIGSHDSEAARDGVINGFTTSPKTSRRKSKIINKPSYDRGSVFGSLLDTCHVESEIGNSFGSADKRGSHTKGCMSMKSAPEEKIAAKYFVSTFPHFVRVMKKFNVCGSYTLFSVEHLPNLKTKIVLHNLNGQCWSVNSIPTKRVQTLHTFCGGWMAFVRDNDIQIGDICIFELTGKCEMRVHICGIGKKGLNYRNGVKNHAKPSDVEER